MSEAIKPPRWEVVDDEDSCAGAVYVSKERVNDSTIFLFRTYDLDLADVVADALNLKEETGLTPRQLVEQRDALVAALAEMYEFFEPNAWGSSTNRSNALDNARAALALVKGSTP
nr:hypothetical protein [Delftia acidovorans]